MKTGHLSEFILRVLFILVILCFLYTKMSAQIEIYHKQISYIYGMEDFDKIRPLKTLNWDQPILYPNIKIEGNIIQIGQHCANCTHLEATYNNLGNKTGEEEISFDSIIYYSFKLKQRTIIKGDTIYTTDFKGLTCYIVFCPHNHIRYTRLNKKWVTYQHPIYYKYYGEQNFLDRY
jgi:hypothetical protein